MRILEGDALVRLAEMPAGSLDACVTDPPYGLRFMGRAWDHGVPGMPYWSEVLRVLKPGASLLAFGGTRTYHRLTCAIEDAGFEVRDCLMWLHGQGFPKSLDVSKAIDKRGGASIGWFGPWLRQERERRGITQKELARHFPSKTGGLTGCVANWELGFNLPTAEQFNALCDALGLPFDRLEEAEREVVGRNERAAGWFTARDGHDITAPATDAARQWDGWGTALKPAWEPIILARKPLQGTVAQNVLIHGTGGINIDGCRLEGAPEAPGTTPATPIVTSAHGAMTRAPYVVPAGRWPANVVLDEEAALLLDEQSGERTSGIKVVRDRKRDDTTDYRYAEGTTVYGDSGGASRFFYCAKASPSERGAFNDWPTVKPLALMRWLVRLVTPPGGTVLDPFMGSGSTLLAAEREGFDAIGIDQDAHACEIARRRLAEAAGPLFAEAAG